MKAKDMQVLGILRFSYPALGGFQIQHESLEERRAFLYSNERMEERLATFETIALPGLKAQTDPNFKLLIVVGECLPGDYRARLDALVQDFLKQKLWLGPRKNIAQPCKRSSTDIADHKSPLPCIQFRHDDDDAVAVTFVEKLRAAVDLCLPLIEANKFFGIDFNRGYSSRIGPNGLEITPSVLPSYGVALAMVISPGFRKTIMNFAHHKMSHFMPMVSFTDQEMFLRGHGGFNDSHRKTNIEKLDFQALDQEGEALMKELFAIDAAHVRKAYSGR